MKQRILEQAPARILIVDDRPENLMVLEALLAPLGHVIDKAGTALEALKLLLRHDFAVILLDVRLPDIDGFETAGIIKSREKNRHIPIIFITAISTDQRNVFQGYSAGAVDYIAKPFIPEILVSKVAVFVDLYLKGEQIKAQAEKLRQSELLEERRKQQEREFAMERKHLTELAAAYAREKRIAEVLQQSFLLAPPETGFPGITVGTLYEAAWEEADLGGDFFDAFLIGDDKVALIVGDVAGKGLQAAAQTAEVKYCLRAFLRECADPANALARANRALLSRQAGDQRDDPSFVCVAALVWHAAEGRMVGSCAGAEGPVVRHASGEWKPCQMTGMPLGIDIMAEYQPHEMQIDPGGVIIMVTDGITEARDRGSLFGEEKMASVLETVAGLGPQQIATTILTEAKQFAGGKLKDDACILVARRES